MSRTTPITSRHTTSPFSRSPIRLPSALSLGQNFRASDSPITMTCGLSFLRSGGKIRPSRSGIPRVAKKPEFTML